MMLGNLDLKEVVAVREDLILRAFLKESNHIEGIDTVTEAEVEAARTFIALDQITIADLQAYVAITQPDAKLRDQQGLDVYVGSYQPPKGGPDISLELVEILKRVQSGEHPFSMHRAYEKLHPFTDGNGRSGRLLWLWQVRQVTGSLPRLGFLHSWYYQSLG